jgi:hypothetical protein
LVARRLEQDAWDSAILVHVLCLTAAAIQFGMANLSLVYGLRLLPQGELERVGSGSITLRNGREEHVTLHLLEGSKEEIEAQLKQSIDAFFDIYPEIQ